MVLAEFADLRVGLMNLILTIRTANRAPKRNYVGATVRSLIAKGADPSAIHLFPTDPDVRWLSELPVTVHVPDHHCTPNENGIRQVEALEGSEAEWIVFCEDDIETCADPMGSMARWLADHARPDVHVYRFFALPRTPVVRRTETADWCPLKEMRGSQAVALMADDARAFAAWATAHPTDWRPKDAPFQDRPTKGFDKLIGYWALKHWPNQPLGLVSRPMLVNHIGTESALYSHGIRNDQAFAGGRFSYGSEVTA